MFFGLIFRSLEFSNDGIFSLGLLFGFRISGIFYNSLFNFLFGSFDFFLSRFGLGLLFLGCGILLSLLFIS